MSKVKHYHIYQRVDKEGVYWRCTSPSCRHRDKKEYLHGKWAQCPTCDSLYLLTNESFRRKNPTCPKCISNKTSSKVAQKEQDVSLETINIIDELFN